MSRRMTVRQRQPRSTKQQCHCCSLQGPQRHLAGTRFLGQGHWKAGASLQKPRLEKARIRRHRQQVKTTYRQQVRSTYRQSPTAGEPGCLR